MTFGNCVCDLKSLAVCMFCYNSIGLAREAKEPYSSPHLVKSGLFSISKVRKCNLESSTHNSIITVNSR